MKRDYYATLPASVRIGSFEYSIVLMSAMDQAYDRIYGDMNSTLQRIRLCAGMSTARLANTFMHEVMHAIHDFHGVGDKTDEENNTFHTTNGLCAFWIANPAAAIWWAEAVMEAQ
jgi:hypothetical protein